jgi:hypothetical protein
MSQSKQNYGKNWRQTWLVIFRLGSVDFTVCISFPSPATDSRDAGPAGTLAGAVPTASIAAGAIIRPGAISDRKAGIALDDLLAEQRPLARFPERCRVDDPLAKRTAIGTIAARDRAWNADELGPPFIAGEPHLRVAEGIGVRHATLRGWHPAPWSPICKASE